MLLGCSKVDETRTICLCSGCRRDAEIRYLEKRDEELRVADAQWRAAVATHLADVVANGT